MIRVKNDIFNIDYEVLQEGKIPENKIPSGTHKVTILNVDECLYINMGCWCIAKCKSKFYYPAITYVDRRIIMDMDLYFENISDAMLFKLTW